MAPQGQQHRPGGAPAGGGPEIAVLLVADDPDLVGFVQQALDGHDLAVAPAGTEAIELIGSGFEPDVVVASVDSQAVTGTGLQRALRAAQVVAQPAVMALGAGLGRSEREALLAGIAADCVEMPVSAGELRARVGNLAGPVHRLRDLMRANQTLSRYGAQVLHDVRGPVFTIVGMAETLAGDRGDLTDGERRDLLGRLAESARELSDVTEALLADLTGGGG